ncbi:MAG: hypothetical protein RIQ52_427 [Pseudomonadota bacterium]
MRASQWEMALAVERALKNGRMLVAEAETGTGKSFAYLVPALASGMKIQVATGTRHLQDQLFHKDVPMIRSMLGQMHRVDLLKGRSNYLCLYRLDQGGHQMLSWQSDAAAEARYQHIRRWAGYTQRGDIAELGAVPETDVIWRSVTSTTENCLGNDCPRLTDCFVQKARKRAQEADLLVINHHLLWAHWALKADGLGELLPAADAVIIDEAHQFADAGLQFLGEHLASGALLELLDEVGASSLAPIRIALGQAIQIFMQHMQKHPGRIECRLVLGQDAEVNQAFAAIVDHYSQYCLAMVQTTLYETLAQPVREHMQDMLRLLQRFSVLDEQDSVMWLEVHRKGFTLHETRLDIASAFAQARKALRSNWIFTSATLSVAGNFDHFCRELALHDVDTHRWDSPFDHAQQALLFLPPAMPDPASPAYAPAVHALALDVVQMARGRTFLLFTSHQALRAAADYLRERTDYPLFVQGTQPQAALLEAFRASGCGVLLGTYSFWEGVDVRGEALSCVVIDKLPFASPGDPLTQARMRVLREKGLNPFVSFQLPQAVIALKQGAGRLIRDIHDRGVLVLCDPRLTQKPYGQQFLKSLPPMPLTRDISDVRQFFEN